LPAADYLGYYATHFQVVEVEPPGDFKKLLEELVRHPGETSDAGLEAKRE